MRSPTWGRFLVVGLAVVIAAGPGLGHAVPPSPDTLDQAAALLPAGAAGTDAQVRNLATARDLLAALDAPTGPSDLALAVDLASVAGRGLFGAKAPADFTVDASPSALAFALVKGAGVQPTPTQAEAIAALDQLPAPVRSALAGVLASFAMLQSQAQAAILGPAMANTLPHPEAVLAARDAFLASTVTFADAVQEWQASGGPTPWPRVGTVVPPVLGLDLDGVDSTYTDDLALVIDIGGRDTYHNNAGGNNKNGGACWFFDLFPASALLDLAGDDTYGNPAAPRGCGANGGAALGVAVLVDAAGSDTYTALDRGTNGGSYNSGLALLVDGDGNDRYTATHTATNGGGEEGGIGMLVDAGGNDRYTASSFGTNGGAHSAGHGALIDAGGDDTYTAAATGVNGGGSETGIGFLLDAGGKDAYTAAHRGSNGGGYIGIGTLVDREGDDTYVATFGGSNGGGNAGGAGLLLDLAGNDRYTAGGSGANGGGDDGSVPLSPPINSLPVPVPAAGLLFDAGGTDTYKDNLGGPLPVTDRTVVPKGTYGAQVDSDDPPV